MRTKASHHYPSQDSLREVFEYIPDDPMYPLASLRRYHKRSLRRGSPTQRYIKIEVSGKSYAMHRLVWIFHNGEIPEGVEIDHIDRDTKNNLIENLRLADRSINCRNRASYGDSGYKGVHKAKDRWQVQVRNPYGKDVYHGTFKDPIEAAKVYDSAMAAYFGPNHIYPTNASEGLIPLEA